MSEAANQLISARPALGSVDRPNQLYSRMQTAIDRCYSVDDCKTIADQANAIAAYFKQTKDDASLRPQWLAEKRATPRWSFAWVWWLAGHAGLPVSRFLMPAHRRGDLLDERYAHAESCAELARRLRQEKAADASLHTG